MFWLWTKTGFGWNMGLIKFRIWKNFWCLHFCFTSILCVRFCYTLKQRERTNLIQYVSSSTQVFFGHLVATSLLMAEQKTMLFSLLKSRRLELDMDLCHQLVRHSSPCISGCLTQFLLLLILCFVFFTKSLKFFCSILV